MKLTKQDGDVLTVAAPAAVTSGAGVQVGQIFGIATTTAAISEDVAIAVTGVVGIAKGSTQVWAVGDEIYWDDSGAVATNVAAAGNLKIGVATAAATNPSTTGDVRLLGPGSALAGVASFSMSAAAGGSNVTEVTITALDAAGNAVAQPVLFDLWLSDAATGLAVTGTTASGTVTAKSASGSVFSTLVSKKALRVQSLATGVFILEITDTAKTGFYPCAQVPGTGLTFVGDVLETADYG